ncbi:MAG: ABC transporter substrate-binding protein [Polyangia bacterium]
MLDPDLWGYRIAHDLICEPLLRRRRPSSSPTPPGAGQPLGGPQGLEQFEGVLAERVRIDGDGRGIDIWVRRGVRFHDGRPLTAHDVRATLEMVLHSAQSAPRTQALLADVARLGLVDKDIVHIDLRRPARGFLAALTEIDILPAAHFANGRMLYQPFNRRPMCTGPFRLAEWKRGSQLILRRAPGYWGTPPAADELRFLIAPDGARGLSRLRQGEADGVLRVPARYLTEQVEPAAQRGRWVAVERDADQVVALLWNGRHSVTGQAAVRQALAGLLDRTRLLREVRAGLGSPVALPPLAAPPPGPPALTLAQANARLDAAGLVRLGPGSGGPRTVAGRPLRLHVLVPAGSFELAEVARRLAEPAARLGLKLEPEVLELGDLLLRLRRGAFEMALVAWAWTGGDPRPEPEPTHEIDLLPLVRLGIFETDPLLAELVPLLAHARESGPDAATARLQALWQQHEPVTLLYRPRQVFVLSPSVQSAGAAPGQLSFLGDFLDLRTLFLAPPGAASPSLLEGRPRAP